MARFSVVGFPLMDDFLRPDYPFSALVFPTFSTTPNSIADGPLRKLNHLYAIYRFKVLLPRTLSDFQINFAGEICD